MAAVPPARAAAAPPPDPTGMRILASGAGWSVAEFVCRLGPHDRPFEERHDAMTVAAVLEGSFRYRSDAGEALLYPGAMLLGNAGACYRCAHDHAAGDRCVSVRLDPALFEEIAASRAGSHRFRFAAPMLPATAVSTRARVDIEAAARDGDALAQEEGVFALAGAAIAAASRAPRIAAAPSARDRRRVGDALRHVEAHADRPLRLDELAGVARMSRHHFLRTFRRLLGVTPYQHVLDVRLRRAALAVRTSDAPIAEIALACGFGDLSTFNARFRAALGRSPREMRKARGALRKGRAPSRTAR